MELLSLTSRFCQTVVVFPGLNPKCMIIAVITGSNVHSLKTQSGADFLTLTVTLDLLKPKSIGCDTCRGLLLCQVSVIPNIPICGSVAEWLGRWTCDQQHESSNPGLPAVECNPGQVVNTHVPLSPSSIIWYQPKGGDALRLGR